MIKNKIIEIIKDLFLDPSVMRFINSDMQRQVGPAGILLLKGERLGHIQKLNIVIEDSSYILRISSAINELNQVLRNELTGIGDNQSPAYSDYPKEFLEAREACASGLLQNITEKLRSASSISVSVSIHAQTSEILSLEMSFTASTPPAEGLKKRSFSGWENRVLDNSEHSFAEHPNSLNSLDPRSQCTMCKKSFEVMEYYVLGQSRGFNQCVCMECVPSLDEEHALGCYKFKTSGDPKVDLIYISSHPLYLKHAQPIGNC